MSKAIPLFSQYNYVSSLPKPTKGSKGAGLRFERLVINTLKEKLPFVIEHLPFKVDYATHIPDALILVNDYIIVVEVKLTHTYKAYPQLITYGQIVANAFNRPIRLLEICKWFVPEVKFPEPFIVVQDIDVFINSNARIGCLFWGH